MLSVRDKVPKPARPKRRPAGRSHRTSRCRIEPAGAKDDRRDARVLADDLRTDRRFFRCLKPVEPEMVELREWTRIAEELTDQRARLTNRVRQQLWRYYPQILTVDSDPAEAAVRSGRVFRPRGNQCARHLTRISSKKVHFRQPNLAGLRSLEILMPEQLVETGLRRLVFPPKYVEDFDTHAR